MVATSTHALSSWAANDLDGDVRACAEAYEQAQVMRNAGKLRESEAQLRVCVRDVCPEFVRADCGQWLSDVRRDMPSVILTVTDGNGRELQDVQVSVDGQVVASKLDGSAFEINPGPHQVTFEYQSQSVTERVDIRQGEKNRVIKVQFAQRADADGDGVPDSSDACPAEYGSVEHAGCALPPAAAGAQDEGFSEVQIAALVAGGVGVAGLATFAIAGSVARSTADSAREECGETGQRCNETELDRHKQREASQILIANIGAVVGGVGAATATALYVWHALSLDDTPAPTQPGDVSWSVGGGIDGGWVGVSTAF